MKKTIILLTILFSLCSIYAKDIDIKLKNSVSETDISYQLYYNDGRVISGNTNEIVVQPLTSNGQTEDFYINATYNKNKGARINVEVTPTEFTTILNGNVETSSQIIPNVNYYNSNKTKLDAGRHIDKTVFKFYLNWEGNSNLAAGSYISNVAINYTIE